MRNNAPHILAAGPRYFARTITHDAYRLDHIIFRPQPRRDNGVIQSGEFNNAADKSFLPGHGAVHARRRPELFPLVDIPKFGGHKAFNAGFLGGEDQRILRFSSKQRHAGHQIIRAFQRGNKLGVVGYIGLANFCAATFPVVPKRLFFLLAQGKPRRRFFLLTGFALKQAHVEIRVRQ